MNDRFPLMDDVGRMLLEAKGEPVLLDDKTREVLLGCLKGPVRKAFLRDDLLPEVRAVWGATEGFVDRGNIYFLRDTKDKKGGYESIGFDAHGDLQESGGGRASDDGPFGLRFYKPAKRKRPMAELKGFFDGFAYAPPSKTWRALVGGKAVPDSLKEDVHPDGGEELSFKDDEGRVFSILVTPSAEPPAGFLDDMLTRARKDGVNASKAKAPSGEECFLAVELHTAEDKKAGRAKVNAVFFRVKAFYDVFVVSTPFDSPQSAVDDATGQLQALLSALDIP